MFTNMARSRIVPPRPQPTSTEITTGNPYLPGEAMVFLFWEPEDAARCRRCQECTSVTRNWEESGRPIADDPLKCDPNDRRPTVVCGLRVADADLNRFLFVA